jgi:hypothetical protein
VRLAVFSWTRGLQTKKHVRKKRKNEKGGEQKGLFFFGGSSPTAGA